MLKQILKALAYSKAPKTTFAVLHPKKAVHLKKFGWDMRHAYAPRVTAVGTVLLAMPIGMALGRMSRKPRVVTRDLGQPMAAGTRGTAEGPHRAPAEARMGPKIAGC